MHINSKEFEFLSLATYDNSAHLAAHSLSLCSNLRCLVGSRLYMTSRAGGGGERGGESRRVQWRVRVRERARALARLYLSPFPSSFPFSSFFRIDASAAALVLITFRIIPLDLPGWSLGFPCRPCPSQPTRAETHLHFT